MSTTDQAVSPYDYLHGNVLRDQPSGRFGQYPDVAAAVEHGRRVLDIPFRGQGVSVELTDLGVIAVVHDGFSGEQASTWYRCPDLETARFGVHTLVAAWLVGDAPMRYGALLSWQGTVEDGEQPRRWAVEHDGDRHRWHVVTDPGTPNVQVRYFHQDDPDDVGVGWAFVARHLGTVEDPGMTRRRDEDLAAAAARAAELPPRPVPRPRRDPRRSALIWTLRHAVAALARRAQAGDTTAATALARQLDTLRTGQER